MQALAWAMLFRSIPESLICTMILRTASGMEVTIQNLLRVDHELVILKGRLAGSQDQGRLYFIPYASIDHLGTMNLIKDDEYQTMFGDLRLPGPAQAQILAPGPLPPVPEPVEVPVAEEAAPAAPSSGSGIRAPIKSDVLERFRARQNGAAEG